MLIEQKTFQGERVILDGNEYKACDFRDCQLVYNGGEIALPYCSFGNCKWEFGGAARRMLKVMNIIYHVCGGSGVTLIEELIDEHVRKPAPVA